MLWPVESDSKLSAKVVPTILPHCELMIESFCHFLWLDLGLEVVFILGEFDQISSGGIEQSRSCSDFGNRDCCFGREENKDECLDRNRT